MLNEFLEYKEYTVKNYSNRIIQNLVDNKHGAGITRALWIITRHELMVKDYWNKNPDDQKRIRDEVTDLLQSRYFVDLPDVSLNGINVSFLAKKIKTWNSEIYVPFTYNHGVLTSNNFSRLLSEAILAGPLKNRRIACNRSFFEDLYINHKADTLYFTTEKSKEKKPMFVSQKDGSFKWQRLSERLFCLIAAYLLESEHKVSNNALVRINTVDLANWMGYQSFGVGNNKGLTYYFNSRLMNKDPEYVPVFDQDENVWTINEQFADRYNFRLEEFSVSEKESGKKKMPLSENDTCYIYEGDKREKTEKGSAPIFIYPKPDSFSV